jgi:hypothetical protein
MSKIVVVNFLGLLFTYNIKKIELNHKSLFAVTATLNAHALSIFETSWWLVDSDRSAMANLLLACIIKTYDNLKLENTLVKPEAASRS